MSYRTQRDAAMHLTHDNAPKQLRRNQRFGILPCQFRWQSAEIPHETTELAGRAQVTQTKIAVIGATAGGTLYVQELTK